MIFIENIAISSEIVEEFFACDIARCKGECCVSGDSGAPLAEEELAILQAVYADVEPYLSDAGKAAIAEQGLFVEEYPDDYSTPLINGGACAYTIFSPEGVALCGIEQAYLDGKIAFKKPISCHLYPIRVSKMGEYEALNYHRWNICKAACKRGNKEGIRIYEFLEEAITRKYGAAFYQTLADVAKNHFNA